MPIIPAKLPGRIPSASRRGDWLCALLERALAWQYRHVGQGVIDEMNAKQRVKDALRATT